MSDGIERVFTCVRCKQECTRTTKTTCGKPRMYCAPCIRLNKNEDHSARIRGRYAQCRSLGMTSTESMTLARTTEDQFNAAIAQAMAKLRETTDVTKR